MIAMLLAGLAVLAGLAGLAGPASAMPQRLVVRNFCPFPVWMVQEGLRGVKETEATVAAVNLGSRGAINGFHVLHALRREAPTLKLWGYVVPPNATKGIVLGRVECLPDAVERQRLVEFLLHRARRGRNECREPE